MKTGLLVPGTEVADRFRVIRLLGTGGMGAVYAAWDLMLQEHCALKLMHKELLSDSKATERFLREIRICRLLTHPNIVRTLDCGHHGDDYYLSMELLRGLSLRQVIQAAASSGHPVSLSESLNIIEQVLSALSFAHQRIVHRDMKPENVFICREPQVGLVKVLDFGIAKTSTEPMLTTVGVSMGTPLYMAPEQLTGRQEVTAQADLYSVGVMMYELVSGVLPVGRFPSPSTIRKECDRSWDDVILTALAPDPKSRYRNAHDMLSALRRMFVKGNVPVSPESHGRRAGGIGDGDSPLGIVIRGVLFTFRWIPPGTAVLGSPILEPGRQADEGQQTVVFDRGFWMQETPVTQEQWLAVMGRNPSRFKGDPRCPVESVSWNQVERFLEKLNLAEPRAPFFRLPSEAEWEYAARAGTAGPFCQPVPEYSRETCDGVLPSIDKFAWYAGNSERRTRAVGELAENGWGLRDVLGNVWEWVQDDYRPGPQPTDVGRERWSVNNEERVVRGGSWFDGAQDLRSARRKAYPASAKFGTVGFRCAGDPLLGHAIPAGYARPAVR